jgi:hypothetical protein
MPQCIGCGNNALVARIGYGAKDDKTIRIAVDATKDDFSIREKRKMHAIAITPEGGSHAH